jgi:pyruvate,water dikinase
MRGPYIFPLTNSRPTHNFGNKASNLRLLSDLGVRIPKTFVCTWDAYLDNLNYSERVRKKLLEELEVVIDDGKYYAVRSSANVEDDLEQSFAGQFTSVLEVRGLDALMEAIQHVWESTQSEVVRTYQNKATKVTENLKMAVIIQEMVSPKFSGVVFSKNPITGLDEIVIEAVRGQGTALVQDGVTPLRWVNKWGEWLVQPEDDHQFRDVVQLVVDQTVRIVGVIGREVDLEWVYDGQELHWLQLRDITALTNLRIYSNKISKEFLPGMIKPLVWSVNIPLVNGAWVDLLTEVIGENELDPQTMARSFYYRAYFDTSTFGDIFNRLGMPRQSLEINMGIVEPPENRPPFRPSPKMLGLLPGLIKFLVDKWRFSGKLETQLPRIEALFQDFSGVQVENMGPKELLLNIDQLQKVATEAAYFNIIVPLMALTYTGILRRQLDKSGVDFETLDLTHDMPFLMDYDPNVHLDRLNRAFHQLEPHQQETIKASDYRSLLQLSGIEGFQSDVSQFIDQFGHLSDSGNDFSLAPWRENPDMILKLIIDYQTPPERKKQSIRFEDLPVSGLRRALLNIFYQRARQYMYYRERVSSAYTYGYGLFRNCYLAIGDHLVSDGMLNDRGDVFYLYDQEIRRVISTKVEVENTLQIVEERKAEMDQYKDIDLPEIIYGDQAPPIVPIQAEKLHGTPTSRGVYSGRARVVSGIQDFEKVGDGDVLVIPYSDVGWTPLFARAGAVIAESGGILSHSSIIAREYGIPAVVSVSGALNLRDDALVVVDGYSGAITIQNDLESE